MSKNRNALEEYAALKLTQEKNKAVCSAIIFLSVIVLIVIGVICNFVNGLFLSQDTASDVIFDCFNNSGLKYPIIKQELQHDNGYSQVIVYATEYKTGLNNLREAYKLMSKKLEHKSLDTLYVRVCDKNENLLISSQLTVTQIKSTNWEDNMTYYEFEQLANIK